MSKARLKPGCQEIINDFIRIIQDFVQIIKDF